MRSHMLRQDQRFICDSSETKLFNVARRLPHEWGLGVLFSISGKFPFISKQQAAICYQLLFIGICPENVISSQKAILNNESKLSSRRYSGCRLVGFRFSYSVARCIIDRMLFGSTEYILTPENPKQMHPKCGKTDQRSGGWGDFVDGTRTGYRLRLSLTLQTIPHAKKIVNIDK